MHSFNFLSFSVSFGFLSLTSSLTGQGHGKVVVCYISTWAVYRPGKGAFSIENLDANLCTHAIYAFAGLDIMQGSIKSLDPWQDLKEQYGKGGYEKITNLKNTHPHLKVTLAIGGWNEGSKNYSVLAADTLLRKKFVKQVSSFIRKFNFDGLDLDWEYPTQRGGQPTDRENFVALTKELRDEFDKYGLLLTSAIGAAKHVIDQAYNVQQISRYLDFLHVMCYDYHGSFDKKIGYNSPLFSSDTDVLSVSYTLDHLKKLGAPAEKLVLGVPFYGRTFQTAYIGNIGESSNGPGFQGHFTREDGFLGYNEICTLLTNVSSGWTTFWDSETSQTLARSDRDVFNGLVNVITFDNARSIANKVRYAMLKKLAGIMVWSVDTDDFLGDCAFETESFADYNYINNKKNVNIFVPHSSYKNYQLLRTINEAIPLALEDINLERIENSQSDIKDNEILNEKSASCGFIINSNWLFYYFLTRIISPILNKL